MPHSYYELHYHIVWATRDREPRLVPEIRDRVYACIRRKCEELGCEVHAIGGLDDHVHVAISIPATVTVAQVAHDAKGSSSHLANQLAIGDSLYWQPGYGAITIRKKDLPAVCRYIHEQQKRHDARNTWPGLENSETEPVAKNAQGSKP